MVKRKELKKLGLLRIKTWETKMGENGNGGKEMSSIELPTSEELVKLKVQEIMGALLGARVLIRENDARLLSIHQELRNMFERSGRTTISEGELLDYVRHYFFRVPKS